MSTTEIRTRRTPPPDFGPTLVAGREAAGLTGREVARRAGINSSYYSHLERGVRCPSFSVAGTLANVLGLDDAAHAVLIAGAVDDAGRDHPRAARKRRQRSSG